MTNTFELFLSEEEKRILCHNIFLRAKNKGDVVVPDVCSRCNSDGNGTICAHHHDYEKPLDVEWLCYSCHNSIHARR